MDGGMTRRGFGAGLLVLAATPALAQGGQLIAGEITYRERIALPEGAVARLQVLDVSLADAPAKRMAAAEVKAGPGSPIRFRVQLPKRLLAANRRYAIRAEILVQGELWFTSTDHIAVDGNTGGGLVIPVQRVDRSAAVAPDTPFGIWQLTELERGPAHATVISDLTLTDDGKAYGTGGCNRFTGGYSLDGNRLTFGALAATRMACAGPGMAQEAAYFDALGRVMSFVLADDGARLLLQGNEGKPLATFARRAS